MQCKIKTLKSTSANKILTSTYQNSSVFYPVSGSQTLACVKTRSIGHVPKLNKNKRFLECVQYLKIFIWKISLNF